MFWGLEDVFFWSEFRKVGRGPNNDKLSSLRFTGNAPLIVCRVKRKTVRENSNFTLVRAHHKLTKTFGSS
jgi:hypothetical protein